MRVLIVVPQQDLVSGNWISARRFKEGLEALRCQVVLQDVAPGGGQTLLAGERSAEPDVALLLHAYRSGKPWLEAGCKAPFVVVMTGTDINLGVHDPEQRDTILAVLGEARAIIIQNRWLAADFSKSYPDFASKVRRPAPGITLGSAPYDLRGIHLLDRERPLFLCPAGLRPVKGVLELLELFDPVAGVHPELQVAFCGPVIDTVYGERFLDATKTRAWAHYLGTIPAASMASAMRGADVVLNNSSAEGLSNSLLEAAALGVPILARHIPGNLDVVTHGSNGLLYSSAEEFTRCATQLLDRAQRKALSNPERGRFDPEQEALELLKTLKSATHPRQGC